MSLLAALVLAAATARVESVSLTTLDSRLAVRVLVSGTPGLVAVHREGDVARVSIMDADLGLRFAGGRRFSWTPSDGFDPALLAATPAKLDRLEIAAGVSEVSVLLHVPPEVSVDVRRDPRGLLLIFRGASSRGAHARRPGGAGAGSRSSPAAGRPSGDDAGRRGSRLRRAGAVASARRCRAAFAPPEAAPSTVEPAPVEPVAGARRGRGDPPRPAAGHLPGDTADLARQLFPTAPAEAPSATTGAVSELYPRLFPAAALRCSRRRRCPRPRSSGTGKSPASHSAPSVSARRSTPAT